MVVVVGVGVVVVVVGVGVVVGVRVGVVGGVVGGVLLWLLGLWVVEIVLGLVGDDVELVRGGVELV